MDQPMIKNLLLMIAFISMAAIILFYLGPPAPSGSCDKIGEVIIIGCH